MKRVGDLFEKIVNIDNIVKAHYNAKQGKAHYDEVQMFDKDPYYYAKKIREMLIDGSWIPAISSKFKRVENGKEREITNIKYFPDRVIHHAIMQVVEPVFQTVYIKDTYQSIKGRGLHKGVMRVKQWLQDEENSEYCLKIDIQKFYPSLKQHIIKDVCRKKIKCKPTLTLLDKLVDSEDGLPIGYYSSQCLGNFVLSFFDHHIKSFGAKYYIRYADDIVVLHKSKSFLHSLRKKMSLFLENTLELKMKKNWQVFPLQKRGLDFLGYRFFRKYTLVRKSIVKKMKIAFKRAIYSLRDISRVMSYLGWVKHANSYNLQRVYLPMVMQMVERAAKNIHIRNPLRKVYLLAKPTKKQLCFQLY